MLENIKSKMDKGGVVGAVFLDFKKAFETVNHDILLSRLLNFNFSPEAIMWFKSYLKNRKQCVRVINATSEYRDYNIGVPQGSILGPLLFSMYVNDLPNVCPPDVMCQMYADDVVLYVHAESQKQAARKLTDTMDLVSKWIVKSCLHLNVKKTVCMFFTKRPDYDAKAEVFIQGQKIEVVHEFKYLGIIIDSQLSFKKHVKKLINSEI